LQPTVVVVVAFIISSHGTAKAKHNLKTRKLQLWCQVESEMQWTWWQRQRQRKWQQ